MKTSREYQREIDAWAKHNFTYIDKVGYGMVEELGEYCHAILKSKQNIRRLALKGGVQVEEKDKWKKLEPILKDCIGDAMIFTLHWSEANETFISFDEVEKFIEANKEFGENWTISSILESLSSIFYLCEEDKETAGCRPEAQRCFQNFALLAKCRGWNWEEILNEVWTEVKQRDWIKFPTDGKRK